MARNPFAASTGTSQRQGSARNPFLSPAVSAPSAPTKKHVSRLHQTFADLGNAALESPGALAHMVAGVGLDLAEAIPNSGKGLSQSFGGQGGYGGGASAVTVFPRTSAAGNAIVQSTVQTIEHPLAHPGNTLLLAAPLLGTPARIGLAAQAARDAAASGGSAAEIAKAILAKPDLGVRELRVGDASAQGPYSRASGSAVTQKAADAILQRAAGKSRLAENILHRRVAKWNERALRLEQARMRAAGTRVAVLGKKLTEPELMALRVVAEETPLERRIKAAEARLARATSPKAVARHEKRLATLRQAGELLDEVNGKPVFKAGQDRLTKTFEALRAASGERGDILANMGLLERGAQQGAKTKAARVAAGAQMAESFVPALADEIRVGQSVRVAGQKATGKIAEIHDGEATVYYPRFSRSLRLPFSKLEVSQGNVLRGAEDITASPQAVFVGNPAERTRFTGRPQTSSTGTFGHTRKPGSLREATGAAVEHALERQDVTRIVAERHREAVRLAMIQRRVEKVKGAGTATPVRDDDVFVWTDKTVSSERIPKEVRRYLDDPEGLAALPVAERHALLERLRRSVFERHHWFADDEAKAEFEQLAAEGKGVFVPRRLLGDAAKRNPNVEAVPGIRYLDAINNAQKALLIYLKANYPLIQGLSNTFMGLVQQGFLLPLNLTRAARLSHRIGPELAAVVDDIMGQGATLQAAFQGEGALSRASQTLARTMTHFVDTPARRASFLHEAARAGFGTSEGIRTLLEDDANLSKLTEVAQRAKEAIVDYEDLSPTERSIARRMFFVYPWTKGATKYAGHFFRDHPAQAAALGILGEQGNLYADEHLGARPSYYKGAFEIGGRFVNPTGLNPFSTPAQVADAILHPTSGKAAGFLSPGLGGMVAALTGRNDIGQKLDSNPATAARQYLVQNAPAVAALRAAGASRSDLVRRVLGPTPGSNTFPDPNDAYWRFLFGGLYPRQFSKHALNKSAALEKSGR